MRKKLLIVFTAVTIMGLAGCQKASQTEDLTKNSEQIKTEASTVSETTSEAGTTQVASGELKESESTTEKASETTTEEPTEETTAEEPATEAQTPDLMATDIEYFQFTNTDEGIYITGLTDKSLDVMVVPDRINDTPVVRVGGFLDCKVTEVVLPDTVTCIEDGAFYDCDKLVSITIPDSVTKIKSRAFTGCKSLENVTIPNGVTKIESYTFFNCESLTDITIPSSVTEIKEGAFDWCSGLTEVVIPDSVTTIGTAAFRRCDNLTSITIPSSVTSIADDVFEYGSNALVIYTSAGSYAEQWANENGYSVQYIQ